MREAADEGRPVERLELVEARAVHDPRDHLAHIVGAAQVGRHDAVELGGVVARRLRRADREGRLRLRAREVGDDLAPDRQRVLVVERVVVGHAADAAMHVRPAQLLGRHLLAGRRLHQRRPAEEDRPGATDDHRLVAHRRDVGPAGGARAHHDRDLRDPARRHLGLVVEDPPEVLLVGEDLRLQRQERPPRVDQVEAGQPVLGGDLLRPQVLLDRDRVVGAALHRRVVGDDDDLLPRDDTDPGHDPGGGRLTVVHVPGRQRAELQEGGVGVGQARDPVAHQQLAAPGVPPPRLLVAAALRQRDPLAQLGHQRLEPRAVLRELRPARVDRALQDCHAPASTPTPPRACRRPHRHGSIADRPIGPARAPLRSRVVG